MDKQLSIVIPTYNRHHFLVSLLEYFFSNDFSNINFIILDSSVKDIKNKNINYILTKNIQCLSYIEFDETITPIDKIHQGLKLVNTKYCVLCADDDVIFIDTLLKCLELMIEDENLICAHGIYLNFNNDLNLSIEYHKQSILNDNLFNRIYKFLNNYESLFYAVYKTNDINLIFDYASKIKNNHFFELSQSLIPLMLGSSVRINKIYCARYIGENVDPSRTNWHPVLWYRKNIKEFIFCYFNYVDVLYEFYCTHIVPSGSSNLKYGNDFYHFMNISHLKYLLNAFAGGTITAISPIIYLTELKYNIIIRNKLIFNLTETINRVFIFFSPVRSLKYNSTEFQAKKTILSGHFNKHLRFRNF